MAKKKQEVEEAPAEEAPEVEEAPKTEEVEEAPKKKAAVKKSNERVTPNDKMPYLPKGVAQLTSRHPDKVHRKQSLIASPIDGLVEWAKSIDPGFTPQGTAKEVKESAAQVILDYEYGDPD